MSYYDDLEKSEIINNIVEISEKIENENNEENVDSKKVTKLMFEQMLRGLYLQL
jgi:hypothetical protein